jgi:hypothetical protein
MDAAGERLIGCLVVLYQMDESVSQRFSASESIDTHIGLLDPFLALSELDVVPIEFRCDDHFFSTLSTFKAMTMVI